MDNKMVVIITRIIDSVKLMVDKILRLREKKQSTQLCGCQGS